MKINKVAFGNSIEAFIEDRFTDGVNIIFSDENNKGKTLVMQGLMYALGNEPIFPSGFSYENYYFFTNVDFNGKNMTFLRHKKTVLLNIDNDVHVFENMSELKYFINDNLKSLPKIKKDDRDIISDLSLIYEMFFVGQDKRNPSNIMNHGYNNKQDFISMLCSINGTLVLDTQDNLTEIKNKIYKVKTEIATTKKLLLLIKQDSGLSSYVNKYSDENSVDEIKEKLRNVHNNIAEYKKKRIAEINRKTKLEVLIDELNSLNRNIEQGKIICADCGSDKIVYANRNFSFDISNIDVRQKILKTINYQIELKEEIINEHSINIHKEQDKLKEVLKEIPEDLSKIILYTDDILSGEDYDNKLSDLNNELKDLINSKNYIEGGNQIAKLRCSEMQKAIIDKMNYYYKEVDPTGKIVFDDLFIKKNSTYSGSEEQEYYFSRTLAINDYFNHEYPIIIDSFRDGELSSKKEKKMIECFQSANKQVLLTSTLKDEEYSTQKYSSFKNLTVIDYSVNQDSKILQSTNVDKFKSLIENFELII